MEVTRLDDGLWRWTTAHPEWQPGGGWEQDVGCVYWEAADAVVLVDPLVPTEEAERTRFLDALDRDVERLGRDVAVLVTCSWHRRSADELGERYGARILAPGDGPLPAGVTAVDAPTASEVVYWLAGAAAVVPGDVLLGTDRRSAPLPVVLARTRPSLRPRGGAAPAPRAPGRAGAHLARAARHVGRRRGARAGARALRARVGGERVEDGAEPDAVRQSGRTRPAAAARRSRCARSARPARDRRDAGRACAAGSRRRPA